MKILLMAVMALTMASVPVFASAETQTQSAQCLQTGTFVKYVQADKLDGASKKKAYHYAMRNTKKTRDNKFFQISAKKGKSLTEKVYKAHGYHSPNDVNQKFYKKCESRFSHKEPPHPKFLNRCLQIQRIEDRIEYMEVSGHTPQQAYKSAMKLKDPNNLWSISSRYAKKLVNLTFFNPQWQRITHDSVGAIGLSLFHGCMQAHQNKVRGFHPLK